ncbi:MAG: serine/threonine protein kinase [Acidobacteria bacterium]|nr:MAG: serine/threonine protein kinase [Acidobacteriota bacterium]
MQLVRGKTLTELLPRNGFPLKKFFDLAIPLTDAVAAAHQEGITHRDLKPDNMMVGDDGRVRVLDFGLAKPMSGFVGGNAESALPTAATTAEGVIIGTLNYMSPEQAQGKAVDARSDIFSLGVVLYEMLTARRPFGGDTPAEVLSSLSGRWGRLAWEMTTDGSYLYFAWQADIGDIWVMDIITDEQ